MYESVHERANDNSRSGVTVEQDQREPASGVTRGQNVVHVLPHDWAVIGQFLSAPLGRVDPASDALQLLVVTADPESAAAVAASAIDLAGDREVRALGVTSARRANRVLKSVHPHVVAASAGDALALVRGTALKLDQLRAVVFAWADELVATGAEATLETLMADLPKEAARIVVTAELSPAVEALVERYARRARRSTPAAEPAGGSPIAVEYVVAAAPNRAVALRRLLDEVDPASAAVVTRSEASEREARAAVRALGFSSDSAAVRVTRGESGEGELVVLYDLPGTREELQSAIGATPRRAIALVQPRQIASLRALAAGGRVTPVAISEAAARARTSEAKMRAELRATLEQGTVARELLALEPLLEDFEGMEIAAAALQLLEKARAVAQSHARSHAAAAVSAETRAAAAPAAGPGRLFVNVGAMENVRPADLMGAILNETGIAKESVGRIDIRDTHSLIDIEGANAEDVASKLTGTMIRGRRVQARVDQERPARSERPRGDRPMRDRAPRGDRPMRGERPARGERGERGFRGDRGDRPPRDRAPRGDRPARGERGTGAGRSDARAARPPRPRREFGDAPRRERE